MFTGITEEIGQILAIKEGYIEIKCSKVLEGSKIGDSIAVSGVCLTLSKINESSFCADISPETFRVTTFKQLKTGMLVNLERAMLCDGRFGGHIVSGHVDGIAKVVSVRKTNECYDLRIELSEDLLRYTVKKGSICVNGISLTVANVIGNMIQIAVIPHTYEMTNLSELSSGVNVNIECDIMAKYVEKFLSTSDNKSRIDIKFLQRNGFC